MSKPPRLPARPLLQDTDGSVKGQRRRRRNPEQPSLPFDAMPARIEPCLALLKSKPPMGPEWLFEIKWDGYRLALHIEPNGIRILTRGGHDWTDRFPAIVQEAAKLGVTTAILDGEAVVLDERGRSDFGMLQNSLRGRGGKRHAGEAILYAFDLLYFDGHDVSGMALEDRRQMLEGLLGDSRGAIRASQAVDGEGEALMVAAREHGLEGIIAKHRYRPYRSGRNGDWLKIKCIQSESFIVIGFEQSAAARSGIGSLLLAAYDGNNLVYVGSVGTSFKERDAAYLRKTLDMLKTRKPAVSVKGKNLVFTSPTLIVEIEFRAWTSDGKLRHASYKGLRELQDNAAIYRMEP